MPFQPLTNYAGYNHVPEAGALWIHPKNGNAYCCACEKDPSKKQDLSVYRKRPGARRWELVARYEGGQASEQQVTMGGAAIEQDGSLAVVTSLIIPGAPYITTEKFQGCWINEPGKDEPWTGGGEMGPPGPAGPAGSGVTLFDAPYLSPDWDNRVLTAGMLLDIPSVFHCPVHTVYLVRFCAVAPQANVRARVGTQAFPFLLTVNTPAPGVDADGQGLIPGPICYVSPARGVPNVWLQIVGHG